MEKFPKHIILVFKVLHYLGPTSLLNIIPSSYPTFQSLQRIYWSLPFLFSQAPDFLMLFFLVKKKYPISHPDPAHFFLHVRNSFQNLLKCHSWVIFSRPPFPIPLSPTFLTIRKNQALLRLLSPFPIVWLPP